MVGTTAVLSVCVDLPLKWCFSGQKGSMIVQEVVFLPVFPPIPRQLFFFLPFSNKITGKALLICSMLCSFLV